MADYIEVDTDTLDSAISTLESNVKEMRDHLKSLRSDVAELSTMWSGRANMAFQRQFGIDAEFMDEFFSMVDQLIACMEFARAEYDKCEDEVGSLVASIQI